MTTQLPFRAPLRAIAAAGLLALCGCAAVGPRYEQAPAVETPVAFKQGQGEWIRPTPGASLERGAWWELFGDATLNALAARVEVSNQNVAAAAAAYAQARAAVAEQRASFFPTVSLDAGADRSGGGRVSATSST
ncbi:MAG TPA: TolC family protein, partial [Ramlibacter sp.]|nr:TolC family protein [Ramlibacter sp.]